MKRYHIPRLAFINKMDRTGARPFAIINDVKEKLGVDCCLMQYPMGGGENFAGMIDLITQKAYVFEGKDGEKVTTTDVPAQYAAEVKKYRHHMLETLAMYSDELMELLLEEQEPTEELIHKVTKQAVQAEGFTPVFVGSAYKNKGVQPLLDAIVRYLPSPLERQVHAFAARAEGGRQEPRRQQHRIPLGARSEQDVRRHGVQDRRRSVRPAHLHADLPGQGDQGRHALQPADQP
jgi:elongation factor G